MFKIGQNDYDTIFIHNIQPNISQVDLRKIFSRFGRVENVWVFKYPHRYGSIKYSKPQDAASAVSALDNQILSGTRIQVRPYFDPNGCVDFLGSYLQSVQCFDCQQWGHISRHCPFIPRYRRLNRNRKENVQYDSRKQDESPVNRRRRWSKRRERSDSRSPCRNQGTERCRRRNRKSERGRTRSRSWYRSRSRSSSRGKRYRRRNRSRTRSRENYQKIRQTDRSRSRSSRCSGPMQNEKNEVKKSNPMPAAQNYRKSRSPSRNSCPIKVKVSKRSRSLSVKELNTRAKHKQTLQHNQKKNSKRSPSKKRSYSSRSSRSYSSSSSESSVPSLSDNSRSIKSPDSTRSPGKNISNSSQDSSSTSSDSVSRSSNEKSSCSSSSTDDSPKQSTPLAKSQLKSTRSPTTTSKSNPGNKNLRATPKSPKNSSYRLEHETFLSFGECFESSRCIPRTPQCESLNSTCQSNHQFGQHFSWSSEIHSSIPDTSKPLTPRGPKDSSNFHSSSPPAVLRVLDPNLPSQWESQPKNSSTDYSSTSTFTNSRSISSSSSKSKCDSSR